MHTTEVHTDSSDVFFIDIVKILFSVNPAGISDPIITLFEYI